MAEIMNIPSYFLDTDKRLNRRKISHIEISSETGEESFRRNVIFTTLDFVINYLVHRLEQPFSNLFTLEEPFEIIFRSQGTPA
jgi:hypothetical protein